MRAGIQKQKRIRHRRRRWGVRRKLRGTAERPRLAFHKSLRHLYAQLIDDLSGQSLLLVTTDTKESRASGKKSFRNVAHAKELGARLGAVAKERGIATAVFDRGGHRYHGVVKAFADAAREAGLKF
jgi:large subunit ribosomal protein L18